MGEILIGIGTNLTSQDKPIGMIEFDVIIGLLQQGHLFKYRLPLLIETIMDVLRVLSPTTTLGEITLECDDILRIK